MASLVALRTSFLSLRLDFISFLVCHSDSASSSSGQRRSAHTPAPVHTSVEPVCCDYEFCWLNSFKLSVKFSLSRRAPPRGRCAGTRGRGTRRGGVWHWQVPCVLQVRLGFLALRQTERVVHTPCPRARIFYVRHARFHLVDCPRSSSIQVAAEPRDGSPHAPSPLVLPSPRGPLLTKSTTRREYRVLALSRAPHSHSYVLNAAS